MEKQTTRCLHFTIGLGLYKQKLSMVISLNGLREEEEENVYSVFAADRLLNCNFPLKNPTIEIIIITERVHLNRAISIVHSPAAAATRNKKCLFFGPSCCRYSRASDTRRCV